jgi:dTDP-glucose 4,6-dehydratase/UDP-glucuronate decarboxylase
MNCRQNKAMSAPNQIVSQDVQDICDSLSDALQPLAGSTLLVTGGSGFVCSYLLDTVAHLNDRFLAEPCRVISVDNLRTGVPQRVQHLVGRPDFRFINHDVSAPLTLGERVRWIIHGAGIASPMFYRRYPLETIDVNVTGTRRMLDLAHSEQVRSALYLSTSEVYGDPDAAHVPTREDYRGSVSCTGPRACYDESKRLAETLCATYHTLYRLPVKVVRPFNVYGPGQRLDDRRIVPDLMAAAISRRPLVLFSDGSATRAFCYISDFITALWFILMSDENGEVFNVGNDEGETSIRQLADLVKQCAGDAQLSIQFAQSEDPNYLKDNPQRRCPDLTKLRSRFPWRPKVSLAEGLKRTLLSYQAPAGADVGRSARGQ